MHIFFPNKFLSQARAHQVLEPIKRLEAAQLAGPHIDRYVYKEVGRRTFLAIGTEQTISDQQVFIWLQVLHRNSREWREFQWDPARYGAQVLQPALSALLPEVNIWLAQPPDPEPPQPLMPDIFKPWFEPINFTSCKESGYVQIYETSNWIQELSKREIWAYWQSWYRMLKNLADNPALGETAPGFRRLRLHRDEDAYILFAHIDIGQVSALLLIHPFLTPPTDDMLGQLPEVRELDWLLYSQPLSRDDLARHTRRTWPAYILADEKLWRKICEDDGGNLALSAEEEDILEQLTGTHWGEKRLPCFFDGRAGSGKSMLLSHVFARYCARKLLQDWEGMPLYVTISESLLNIAQEIVLGLLEHNSEIKSELDKLEDREIIKTWFRPLHTLLKDLLGEVRIQGGALSERFQDSQRISYHRFRRLYLEERLTADEQRLAFRNRRQISAETAWFVIRALIKGISTDGYLDPKGFDNLPRGTRGAVSRELFIQVHEQVWKQWYYKLWKNHGLWDDQDLVRAVLNESPELPEYTLICCDESQDLTHIEARLLFRMSVLNRYPLPESFPSVLPFLFAGDPLQTVNPSGFRWAALKKLFHDEVQTIVGRDIPLQLLPLRRNYRSGGAIVGFLNLIQAWRADLFDWKETVFQYAWSPLTGTPPTCFVLNGQVSVSELRDMLKDTPIIVDAEEGGEMEKVKGDPLLEPLFKEDSKGIYRNLLTPAAAKGHEHPKVVVYGFGDGCPEHIWDKHDTLQETKRHRAEHFWNKLYVALSRATAYLFIIDTEEGFHNLWEHLCGNSPDFPESMNESVELGDSPESVKESEELGHSPESVNEEQLKPRAMGLFLGTEDDLKFLREKDPQGVADRLKKAGQAEQSCTLLRKARAYYQSLNMFGEADECEAISLEVEEKFAEAGRLWERLKSFKRAEEAYWRGLHWIALDKLYELNPDLQKPERVLLTSFLSALQKGKSNWALAVESFLPRMADWLQSGDRPPLVSSQWSALDEALRSADLGELSPQGLRSLASVTEQLHQYGRQTGELAANCWYELRDWRGAIRCWDTIGRKEHTDYYRAMAEVTSGIEKLKWWNKAGEYKKTVYLWRSKRSYGENWMEYVIPALKHIKAWKELIEVQLFKQKRSARQALDSLLEGYKELADSDRALMVKKVYNELSKRKLFVSFVKLFNTIHKLEPDTACAERLGLNMEVRLCRSVLAGDVDRGSLRSSKSPQVRKWWKSLLERIESNPDRFCPPLSAGELSRLMTWAEADDTKRTRRFLERWAGTEDSPNQTAAREAFEGLDKKKQGPEVIKRKKRKPLEHDGHSSRINLADGLVTENNHDTGASKGAEPKADHSSKAPDLKEIKIIKRRKRESRKHDGHSSTSENLTDGLVTGSGENNHDTDTDRGSEPKASDSSQAPDLKAIKTIFIEQLRLRNFRSYLDACLSFEDFTILIGQNGAGKSTLREALEIMRDALTDSLNNALSRRGGLECWIRQGGEAYEKNLSLAIQFRLESRDDSLQAVYGFELLLTEGGGYRIFQEHLAFSTDHIPHFHREGDQLQTTLSLPELSLAPDQLAFPLLAGSHPFWKTCIDTIKGVSAYVLSPERMREETTALNQSRLASDGQNAANVIKELENHPRAIEILTRRMCTVIPGIHRVFAESFRGRRILGFEQKGQRMIRLDATQVSDGTLRILGILLAIYQRPRPTLIFLEELEDSIHPEAFTTITEAIEEAAEQTQIVITSHSPVALMQKPITEARTRLIRWELGRSDIYKLESHPPEEDDYAFSVGEMLQFNAIQAAPLPSSVKGGFFEVEPE